MVKHDEIKYDLQGDNGYYQVFDLKGRFLMYFKISTDYLASVNCPPTILESNINLRLIYDNVVDYCANKIQNDSLPKNKIEFYLNKIIGRILVSDNGHKMLMNPYFLNKRGKLQLALYNVYNKIKERITDNLDTYFQMEVPYTEKSDPFMMDIVNSMGFYNCVLSNGLEINREIFECNIPNQKTGLAYVDVYHSNAKFFFIWDKEKPQDEEYGYVMMVEYKIVLLYGIKC